ncbi:MAG: alpha-amylase family glycosyl hydrolase [Halobacteriota archaeon]|nr:alpha-amylase family glycosyl hydrolase [Halobacteriota archaeon]
MLRVGIYLPNIRPENGYELIIKIIHEKDQFTPGIEPEIFNMDYEGNEYGLWSQTIDMSSSAESGRYFGSPGKYLYRYQLLKGGDVAVGWFSDPFARSSGRGTFSAFELGDDGSFEWEDGEFSVPKVDDMVIYELMVGEFNNDFEGVISRLDYLESIGVNVIEFMPVTNTKEAFRWGYMPLSYFAPEDRYGRPTDMKRMINECHKKDIAVILDAVYAHGHHDFAYNTVYNGLGVENPMMGHFAEDAFGLGTDYNKQFTREFFYNVNCYWLDEYHVDGFRYDYVPGFYDSPEGNGYASLVYNTYQYSKDIPRFSFDEGGYSRIIQCAEHLPDPQGIISNTYSNCCWQNLFMDEAISMAHGNHFNEKFAHLLCHVSPNYSYEYHNPSNDERFPVNVLQYIETHDHSRFINNYGLVDETDALGLKFGDRGKWYKLQPYVIALYTCQGIPMLWQGQEFGENYSVPGYGPGRVFLHRPIHWEYFYDDAGRGLIRLHRKMGAIRRKHAALRSTKSYYYFNESVPDRGVIVYSRSAGVLDGERSEIILVFINFNDYDYDIWVPFPESGRWDELIHNQESIDVINAGDWHKITVPSNYGRLFLHS